MNINFYKQVITCFVLLVSAICGGTEIKKKKVVFVIVDGISYDMIVNAVTPNIDYIASKGSLFAAYIGGGKDTYTETPTISAVGYNSLLTSTWVNKHNVWDNSIKAPNYNYPTIFSIAKQQNPELITAVFSTWEDNRTKLIEESSEATNNKKIDYAFDGLELDEKRYPHDNDSEYIKEIDEAVTNRAYDYIIKHAPDLSWVYLQYTDDIGHLYGDSDKLNQAISFEDQLIGKLYSAVEKREKNHNEEWLFIVTTDHGRSEIDGKHHGGQSDRERSIWILSNQEEWKNNVVNFEPSIVDITPSIVEFLGLDVPQDIVKEWEGNSLFHPVEISNLQGNIKGSKLNLTWNARLHDKNEMAELWLATTNHKKEGGKDEFIVLEKINLSKESRSIDIKKYKSNFYKVYLKSSVGNLNTWIF